MSTGRLLANGNVYVDGIIIGHVKSWIANKNHDAFPEKMKCSVCGSPMAYGSFKSTHSQKNDTWGLSCTNNNCKSRTGTSRYDIAKETVRQRNMRADVQDFQQKNETKKEQTKPELGPSRFDLAKGTHES